MKVIVVTRSGRELFKGGLELSDSEEIHKRCKCLQMHTLHPVILMEVCRIGSEDRMITLHPVYCEGLVEWVRGCMTVEDHKSGLIAKENLSFCLSLC
ncbi:hypothetical protein ABKV19_003414 [Rosa sericea]